MVLPVLLLLSPAQMNSTEPARPAGRPATSLRLWIPLVFGLFVVIGSVGLLLVFEQRQQKEERAAFENLARVNAAFMERTRLQRTSRMANRLGEVIGAELYFRDPNTKQVVTPSDRSLPDEVKAMRMDGKVFILSDGRFAVGVRDQAGVETIFIRSPEVHGYGQLGREAWLALVLFWLLSLALGLGLSRWVSQPLQSLVRALPQIGTTNALPSLPVSRRDEIGALARVLEQTHQSLGEERERRRKAERMALLGRMATSIAHEIRNPAAAIRLHTELLDPNSPGDFAQSRRLILSESERLENLVAQWLNYSRPEPPRLSEIDLVSLLDDVMDLMQPQARHMGVTIAMSSRPSSPITVQADRQRLQQVFSNLVQNAIQAMPTGGAVDIALDADERKARVAVSDQGEGFSPTARDKLGEPFFSEKEGGLGLGLAVASEICRAHGGRLTLIDDGQQGARIRVELRRRPPQDEEDG